MFEQDVLRIQSCKRSVLCEGGRGACAGALRSSKNAALAAFMSEKGRNALVKVWISFTFASLPQHCAVASLG